MVELTQEWMKLANRKLIRPKEQEDGPIFENTLSGDDVDIFMFPSPRFYELDGGRYFGTTVFLVVEDPRPAG